MATNTRAVSETERTK